MSPTMYDRNEELQFLNELYSKNAFNLVVIYGRRRVGKTTIIKAFCEDKKHIYFLCTSESIESNLAELRREFFELTGDDTFLSISGSLFDLLKYLVRVIGNQKVILAFDEFPSLLEADKSVGSVIQKAVDELLVNTRLFLIISGSSISMMENEVLGYSAPLYGRRTGSLKVEPFRFEEIHHFYRNDIIDLVKAYSVFGSMPFYLAQMEKSRSVQENIRDEILSKNVVLYEEPNYLLRQEFREIRNYEAILAAIASGKVSLNEISQRTGMDSSNLSKYLYLLGQVKLIEYVLPYGSKRNGIYAFGDNFLRFYFRFVHPNRKLVEIGETDRLARLIEKDINAYYGRVFEEVVMDLIGRHKLKVPFEFDSVHRFWKKDIEIDGLLVNSMDSSLTLVEVKWSEDINAEKILDDLRNKVAKAKVKNRINGFVVVAKSFKTRTKEAYIIDLAEVSSELEAGT